MSRSLTQQAQERFLRWGQERGALLRSLGDATVSQKVRAYKQLEKRILAEAPTAFEQQEMRRRITEDLLMVTRVGPWRRFSPYLRRMERLGYSSMDCHLLVCGWSAQASQGSVVGRCKTAALIADFERRARASKLHPAQWEQINHVLARARQLLDYDGAPRIGSAHQRSERTKSLHPGR